MLYRAEEELLAAWQIDSSDVNLAYSIAAVKSDAYKSFEKEVKPWLDVIKKHIGTIQTSFLLFPLSHTVMSRKKDYKQALAWYEKYLNVATPESKGYVFAVESVRYLKGELFMEGEAL